MTMDMEALLAEREQLRAENQSLKAALGLATRPTNPNRPLPDGLLAYTLDHTNDLVYWLNPQAEIVYANQAVCRALGYSLRELYQMRVADVYNNFSPERWQPFWDDLQVMRSITYEWPFKTKYGLLIPTEITANLVNIDGLDYCCAVVRVTEERKTAEEKIRLEQEYKNALWEAIPDLMLLMNSRGVLLDMRGGRNFPSQFLNGLVGSTLFEMDLPEEVKMLLHTGNKAAIATDEPQTNEFTLRPGNSSPQHYESRAVKCGPNKAVLIVRDITEQKHNREKIRDQQAQQTAMINAIPDNIYIMTENGVYLDFRGGKGAVFIAPDQIVGSNIRDSRVPETVKNLILEANYRAITTGQTQLTEYSLLFEDNILRYFESRSVRYGPKTALRIVREITERKQAELERERMNIELQTLNQELMDSQVELEESLSTALALKKEVEQKEQLYRELVKCSPDIVLRIGKDYRIQFAHSPYTLKANLSEGKKLSEEFAPETWPKLEKALQQVFQAGRPVEFEYSVVDSGTQIVTHFQAYCSPIRDLGQAIVAAYVLSRDVTITKLASQAVEQARRNLQTTVDNGLQSTILLDRKGNILLADKKIVKIFQDYYQVTIENNKPFADYLLVPELKQSYLKNLQRALKGEIVRLEREAIGSLLAPIWIDVIYSPVTNDKGEVTHVVLGQLNITDRKEAEERVKKINDELVAQNNRLNHYSYIVSHNLRAPVASLIGLVNLFQMEGYLTPQNEYVYSLIRDSALGLDGVLQDLNKILNETRAIEEQKVQIDLAQEVSIVTTLLERDIQRSQAVVEADFAQVPTLYSVRALVHSVLINLVSNAIKYRRPEVAPLIRVQSRQQGDFVELKVSDNGLGIDLRNQRDNLFKLYKRFHNHVDGKGIGLYLVKAQVEMLGGQIDVESEPGLGTTFTILLKSC
jgi:PAS domain S-box-containing protein